MQNTLILIFLILGFITSIQTRGGEHHHQAWLTTGDYNVAVFKLTACQDAYVLFTPYFGQAETNTYEIGLGIDSNTRSIIKKDYVEVITNLRFILFLELRTLSVISIPMHFIQTVISMSISIFSFNVMNLETQRAKS